MSNSERKIKKDCKLREEYSIDQIIISLPSILPQITGKRTNYDYIDS